MQYIVYVLSIIHNWLFRSEFLYLFIFTLYFLKS